MLNQLCVGVNFDKKRFKRDLDIFKAKDDNKEKRQRLSLQELLDTQANGDFKSVEELGVFRHKNRIRVYGSECPAPVKSIAHLLEKYKFPLILANKCVELGFQELTPIQMQAIPIMLEGRDVICCAYTGSGKTLAFVLPLLQQLGDHRSDGIRALILAPAAELAQQLQREVQKLIHNDLKVSMLAKSNMGLKEKPYDILIGTPQLLVKCIDQHKINLGTVTKLVIDEADKMFQLGFVQHVDAVLAACTNTALSKSLFSATIDSNVEQLAGSAMMEPLRVVVGHKSSAAEQVEQKLVYVGLQSGKLMALEDIIREGVKPPVLIFVESCESAEQLSSTLQEDFPHVHSDVIHSAKTPKQREEIINNFRRGDTWILITTDLLSRGIDFKGVRLVINYDFPPNLASYIHRIGRTGRAGRPGKAISFFLKSDAGRLRSVAHVIRQSGGEVPEWMLQVPKTSKRQIKK